MMTQLIALKKISPLKRQFTLVDILFAAGVALVLVLALFGDKLGGYSATRVVAKPFLPPQATHWFGTDSTGMDVFARTLAGFQYDVAIGVAAAAACTITGILIGVVTASLERSQHLFLRSTGQILVRCLDLLQAIPSLIIGLVLMGFFSPSILTLTLAMVVANGPPQARLVRAEVLKVSGEVFIENARVSGEGALSRTFRYVLPNSSWPAIENATLVFASSISLVAGLGFLGVGLAPPTPEWGSMISTEQPGMLAGKWWPVVFPAVTMLLTIVFAVLLSRRYLRFR